MELENLRAKINDIDKQLLSLFAKRMDVCREVAKYKIKNDMPVFQTSREEQVIEKIRSMANDDLADSAQVLFTTIMDISKSLQYQLVYKNSDRIEFLDFPSRTASAVACPGTEGSYSHMAAKKIFSDCEIKFYDDFESVARAVVTGKSCFGILPIQNSTAGSVHQAYELLKKYDCHIAASTKVKVSHCLAVKPETDIAKVKEVYSHEQALMQCCEYLQDGGFTPKNYVNTALAAEFVKKSEKDVAAICSKDCAQRLGLKIVSENITNADENYTRFILLSKDIYSSEGASTISVSLSLPHTKSALYRLLTKFSVAGLNLLRIESGPVAGKDFDVVFYLDFEGSVLNPQVARLIAELKSELTYFKFLGNYKEIIRECE